MRKESGNGSPCRPDFPKGLIVLKINTQQLQHTHTVTFGARRRSPVRGSTFSGEAKDSVNFSFFILLHKRAKPIHPPYISILPPTYPPIPPPPPLCDAVGGAFCYLVLRMQNPCRRQAIIITLGANATTCRRQAICILVSIPPPTHPPIHCGRRRRRRTSPRVFASIEYSILYNTPKAY